VFFYFGVIDNCFLQSHLYSASTIVVCGYYYYYYNLIIIIMIVIAVDRDRSIQSKFRSFDLAVLPQNNNQYFVCTDLASIIHTRYIVYTIIYSIVYSVV